ncbi:hypothetical protein EC968_006522 [Mortierella alpina]|nr:hypothetical protein EC968_006522 [Mortierella alpina]
MASILFDDISFPRELYDPDTFEFVPPVSTLLAFTPHILSQLAKTSESEQEPIPIPSASVKDEHKDKDKDKDAAAAQETPSASSSSSSTSKDFFSTFRTFASSQSTQRIFENGIYLAGRYLDGSAAANASASSSRRRESDYEDRDRHRYDTRGNSYWFGQQDNHRDQERQRMRELEERLRQMERDMSHNSATARSEIDAQRRERYKLEQELESQKTKVMKLEREMKERQSQDAHKSKQEQEKTKKAEKAEQAKRAKEAKTDGSEESEGEQSSEKTALLKKNASDHSLASNPAVLASVGVASLVMSMYAAHQASSTYSVVSFHDQLEMLMTQCQSVVQSTEAWISEQFLEVPDQIREDLKSIKELMETIQRLDPRVEKKAEAVAWSVSAVGSLGAVGGAVLGSMTVMASGGTVVIGCALYGVISRARYNGPEYSAARTMMQLKAAQILKTLGVNPASPVSGSPSRDGRASLIHDDRIQKLRIEFERREAHDMRDADEIDGLAVEEALRQSSFSAPFVSQKASARAARLRQQSATEPDDVRPARKMKTESKRVSACAS